MKGCFEAFLALCLLLTAVPASVAPSAAANPATNLQPSLVAGPTGWRSLFQTPGVGWDFAVDPARGRILVGGSFQFPNYTQLNFLLVLGLDGSLQRNISLPGPVAFGAHRIAIDPATGAAFVATSSSRILKVDPGSGTVQGDWTERSQPDVLAFAAGALYTLTPFGDLLEISPASGAELRNWTSPKTGVPADLLVDPGAHWLLFSDDSYAWRIDLSNGSRTYLGWTMQFALSADASRVFLQGVMPSGASFAQMWVANGTIQEIQGMNGGPFRANPRTGVLAFATTGLFDPENGTGFGTLPVPGLAGLVDLGWSADGTELVGLAITLVAPETINVTEWGGTPWVEPFTQPVVNPDYDLVCTPIRSTALMNMSSLRFWRDGVPYTPSELIPDEACFNTEAPATQLADGPHTGRVAGFDRLGQPLNATLDFATDSTPPTLALSVPQETETSPYALEGWMNDSYPRSVLVAGTAAHLVGDRWSAIVDLWIGNNTVSAIAEDQVGLTTSASWAIRFWPRHTENLTNTTDHVSLSVPPGWTGEVGSAPGGTPAAIALTGPITSIQNPIQAPPPLVLVTAVPDANATSDPSYVYSLIQQARDFLLSRGATVVTAPYVRTIANHTAATVAVDVTLAGWQERYTQTVISAPEWHLFYVVTGAFPDATLANHTEDFAWILEGLTIAPAPPPNSGPLGGEVGGIALAGGIAAAVAAVGVALWIRSRRRRQAGPPPLPPEPKP